MIPVMILAKIDRASLSGENSVSILKVFSTLGHGARVAHPMPV